MKHLIYVFGSGKEPYLKCVAAQNIVRICCDCKPLQCDRAG
jgi:hypothetical protein